jgi:hypothetical protein
MEQYGTVVTSHYQTHLSRLSWLALPQEIVEIVVEFMFGSVKKENGRRIEYIDRKGKIEWTPLAEDVSHTIQPSNEPSIYLPYWLLSKDYEYYSLFSAS